MQVEAKRERRKLHHEVDEFEVRDDLCSWRLPI
jgi:hypothetical protein